MLIFLTNHLTASKVWDFLSCAKEGGGVTDQFPIMPYK